MLITQLLPESKRDAYLNLKVRVHEIVEKAPSREDRASYYFDLFIMVLIVANIVSFIISTVPEYERDYGAYFEAFEMFCCGIFSIEILLRFWTYNAEKGQRHTLRDRLAFFKDPYAIVDLLAVLPILSGFVSRGRSSATLARIGGDQSILLRLFRLLKFLRVLKFGRYSRSVNSFIRVVQAKKEELVVAMLIVLVMLVVSSSCIHFLEYDSDTHTGNEKFNSIPAAMWWSVATLTTVGYGDVYPETAGGKFFAAIVAVLGIGIFALPAGIIASGFTEEFSRRREAGDSDDDEEVEQRPPDHDIQCPHCQQLITAEQLAAAPVADNNTETDTNGQTKEE